MTNGFAMLRPMSIAARIAQARKAKGISQDELAKAVGVTRTSVSYWEDGSVVPRGKRLPQIANALDVDATWLETGKKSGGGFIPMPVKGEVAAGVWKEVGDLELDPIPVAPISGYPIDSQYGLLVRGNSLNKIAADSEYIVVVDVLQSGLHPRPGDLVVVHKHRHGTTEATAKRLVKQGNALALKPESDDPRYQEVLPLGRNSGDTEIVIAAIVLGKFSAISRGST